MNKEQVKELAECNAIYEFNKIKRIYDEFTDEYVRHFCNKLAELRGGIDDVHTCSCHHNSNSRDDEPCCRCDSKQTNADRIRNMSDEELAEFMSENTSYYYCGVRCKDRPKSPTESSCFRWLEWLQSEAE